MPQAAPQAKEGEAPPEQPKSIAGLIGNMFATSPAQAKPAESEQASLRGSETPAKTKRSAPVRTASAPAPHEAAPAKTKEPKAVASTPPVPTPRVQQAKKQDNKQDKAPDTELRTAYSSSQTNKGVLPGAQPVVPAGTFESRWTALR
jgi:hypothetical protein